MIKNREISELFNDFYQIGQSVDVGETSSSSATLVDGQRGSARNRDSTTDTQVNRKPREYGALMSLE